MTNLDIYSTQHVPGCRVEPGMTICSYTKLYFTLEIWALRQQ